MKILLVRHAPAMDRDEFADQHLPDSERPLTKIGEKKMRRAARGLQLLVEDLGILLTSPYTRAVQTAEILAEQFPQAKASLAPELIPEESPEITSQMLRAKFGDSADATVTLVSHDPLVGALSSYWLSGSVKSFVNFKKGAVMSIEFPHLPAAGQGELRWFMTASSLSRLST